RPAVQSWPRDGDCPCSVLTPGGHTPPAWRDFGRSLDRPGLDPTVSPRFWASDGDWWLSLSRRHCGAGVWYSCSPQYPACNPTYSGREFHPARWGPGYGTLAASHVTSWPSSCVRLPDAWGTRTEARKEVGFSKALCKHSRLCLQIWQGCATSR